MLSLNETILHRAMFEQLIKDTMENTSLNLNPGQPIAAICNSCKRPYSFQDLVKIGSCQHQCCKNCLIPSVTRQLESGKEATCPGENGICQKPISDEEMQNILPDETYEKFQNSVLEKPTNKNLFECKNNLCRCSFEIKSGSKLITCPSCQALNCVPCEKIHLGKCPLIKPKLNNSISGPSEPKKRREMNGDEVPNSLVLLQEMQNQNESAVHPDPVTDSNTGNEVQENIKHENNTLENSISGPSESEKNREVNADEVINPMVSSQNMQNQSESDVPTQPDQAPDSNAGIEVEESINRENRILPGPRKSKREKDSVTKSFIFRKEYSLRPKKPTAERNKPLFEFEECFHNLCKCDNDDTETRYKCSTCLKTACTKCKGMINVQSSGEEQKETDNSKPEDDEKEIEKLVQQGVFMRCPKCTMLIEKNGGCDWLKCTNCKTEICWATKGPRWGPKGKGDITGGCRCNVDGKKCHPDCKCCH